MGNEMTFSGNHIFHYTNLDAAIKIILSNSIRFGSFANMNDIAESNMELLDNIDSNTFRSIAYSYRSISFTADANPDRGFAIDCMWGYYSEKGRGVCLVFDKTKLMAEYEGKYSCKGVPQDKSIEYKTDYSQLEIALGKTSAEIESYLREHIKDIFYKKDDCWSYEREIRLLTKSDSEVCLPLGESLIGAIIHVPDTSFESSEQYKLLSALKKNRHFNIYNYKKEFGKKYLFDEQGKDVWPLVQDYYIDMAH